MCIEEDDVSNDPYLSESLSMWLGYEGGNFGLRGSCCCCSEADCMTLLLLLDCMSDGAKLVLLRTRRCAPPKLEPNVLVLDCLRLGVPNEALLLLLLQPTTMACGSSSSARLDDECEDG